MKGIASERSASSRILRICVALIRSQRMCVALIREDERSVDVGFVCKLDQRCRIGGCTRRGCSREGHLDYTGLSGWR